MHREISFFALPKDSRQCDLEVERLTIVRSALGGLALTSKNARERSWRGLINLRLMDLAFYLKMLSKSLQRKDCPYCNYPDSHVIARRQLILQLRQCPRCQLIFRFPKDKVRENPDFYARPDTEKTATGLPTDAALLRHIENNFISVGEDLRPHLQVIRKFSTGKRLLDFGASWGYCTYQFNQAGYQAIGLELSHPQVRYGRNQLRIPMVTSTASLEPHSFDVIYAAHVLEYMSDPKSAIKEFRRLTAPGGTAFIFVANGSSEPVRGMGTKWPTLIEGNQLMVYTAEFLKSSFEGEGYKVSFASSPYNTAPRAYSSEMTLEGEELLALANL